MCSSTTLVVVIGVQGTTRVVCIVAKTHNRTVQNKKPMPFDIFFFFSFHSKREKTKRTGKDL